jgi:hypothetical protein
VYQDSGQAVGWQSVLQILTGVRDFSLHKNVQTSTETHPVSYSFGTGITFPWGETAEV